MDQEDPPEPPLIKEEWSPSLDQEDPPEPRHIKEEQEEVLTSQVGEQLRGLEEADITKFTFTPVTVKSEEDDEEKPQSSQLHQRLSEQMETEADGEDSGGPEPARNFDTDGHLQPEVDDKMSDSEAETDDSCDWEETSEPQSGSNPLQNSEVPVSDQECNNGKTSSSSSECATSSGQNEHLQEHNGLQTEEKPFSCSVCDKSFLQKNSLTTHMRCHSAKIMYSCSVCERNFASEKIFSRHERSHKAKKTFSCPDCGKSYSVERFLMNHMRLHSGEKYLSCSLCKETFSCRGDLVKHMDAHKDSNKEYGCSVCGKRFSRSSQLNKHQCGVLKETSDPQSGSNPSQNSEVPVSDQECSTGKTTSSSSGCATSSGHKPQTEEKPFSCPHCGRSYNMERCLMIHLEEKYLSCSVCKETFPCRRYFLKHMMDHRNENNGYGCSVCGKRFSQWTKLSNHQCGVLEETREPQSGSNPSQNSEVPVSDQECRTGKTSSSSSGCATSSGHKPQTEKKPFRCSVCGKTYALKTFLTCHMRLHTKTQFYSCSICQQAFITKSSVSIHERSHTEKNPLSCSVCGKGFTRKEELIRHMKAGLHLTVVS